MFYDYKRSMREDIREWLRINDFDFTDNITLDCENLCEELWAEDSVTGNGVWGYDTEENCLKYLSENLPLIRTTALEMAIDMNRLLDDDHPAIKMDCIIRCSLLDECVMDVLLERKGELDE